MPTKKSTSSLPLLVAAVFFLILMAGLLFAIFTAKQNQDIRQKAAGEVNPVQLSFRSSRADDTHLQIDVYINTQGYQLAGADIRGTLANANTSDVVLLNSNALALDDVMDSITQNGSAVNFRAVRFASLDPNVITSTHGQDQPLFSYIIANPQNSQITASVDQTNSQISVLNISNVAVQYPASQTFVLLTAAQQDQSKKTCNQNCATDTECQSSYQCYKGACRRQPNLEDAACGVTPDQGIHRICNQYCADTTECATGFTCYYNQCRNPRNITNNSCANPATPRPVVRNTGGSSAGSGSSGTTAAIPTPVAIPSNAVITSVDGQPVASPSPSPTDTPLPNATFPLETPTATAFVTPSPTLIPQPTPIATTSNAGSGDLIGKFLIVIGIGIAAIAIYFLYQRSKKA